MSSMQDGNAGPTQKRNQIDWPEAPNGRFFMVLGALFFVMGLVAVSFSSTREVTFVTILPWIMSFTFMFFGRTMHELAKRDRIMKTLIARLEKHTATSDTD